MISEILGNILYISRSNASYQRRKNAAPELITSKKLLISYVCRNPGLSQEQLYNRFGVDKSTIAHLVADLEKDGYFDRKSSEKDGRCKLVYPTDKAIQLYPVIHECYEEFTSKVLEGLTAGELEILTELTTKMRENAKKAMEGLKT